LAPLSYSADEGAMLESTGGHARRSPSRAVDRDRSEGLDMNAMKMLAIGLIVAGALGLLYGSFSYTKQTHDVKLGPVELSVQEKQTVNVPVWLGAGAIAVGIALLVFGGKQK
jgi:heme/copper-type cytochrome/quinol oxidase subunit 2